MTGKLYLDHNPQVVALVCMGPSIVDAFNETLTQEFKPEWADEVWAINMASNIVWHDVVFWMDDMIQQHARWPWLIEALNKRGRPVITSRAYRDLVPTSYDYPIEEVSNIAIPIFGKPYLNNGVAMAIAYAIHKRVKAIKVYGADFSYPNRDYAESGRACVEAWITLANFAKIAVGIGPTTSLFDQVKDHGIYGFAEQPAITLPNGAIFQYRKLASATRGIYVPEDSSGAPPVPGSKIITATCPIFEATATGEQHGAVPGANGGAPAAGGPAELRPVAPQAAAPAAIG